jgi:hypothetical protein
MLAEAPKKSGRVFYTGAFRRSWASACVKTALGRWIEYGDGRPRKYQGLIVHDRRRSAVKNLRDAGVPETVVMKISGHKTQSVFRRYSIVSTDDLHRAMNQVQSAAGVMTLEAERKQMGGIQPEFNTSLMANDDGNLDHA